MLKKTKIIDIPLDLYVNLLRNYNFFDAGETGYTIYLCQYHYENFEYPQDYNLKIYKEKFMWGKRCDRNHCQHTTHGHIVISKFPIK
jgi:hypothetical protein